MTSTAPSSAPSAAPGRALPRRLVLWLVVLVWAGASLGAATSARAATPSLYVANSFGFGHPASLTSYAAGAAGNAAPVTDLVGAATGLDGSLGVARDPQGLTWVANSFSPPSLTAYAGTASGNVAPAATISGAATGLSGPAGLAFDVFGRLAVANSGAGGSITEYAAGARGNVKPAVTISGPSTGLSDPRGVAFDATGHLFVANVGNDSVTEYAPGASGDASPLATLQGRATGLHGPTALAFDVTGRLYVANPADGITGTVTEYAPGASANAAPVATIAGAASQLTEPDALGFDGAGNLFVGDYHDLVAVFAPGATGNVAPQRVIAGAATALDGVDGLLVVAAPTATTQPVAGRSETTATLAGTVVPHGVLSSYHFEYGTTTAYGTSTPTINAGVGPGPQAALASLAGLSAGTTYHYRVVATSPSGTVTGSDVSFTTVASGAGSTPMRYLSSAPFFGGATSPPSILGFPAGARGNLAPTVTIAGSQTMLTSPTGVAVDAGGDVFAADIFGGQVLEFAPGARGNVAPIARIPIPDAAGEPFGLALSPTGRLLVSGYTSGAVYEYARSGGAWGLVHTISGSATGLVHPAGVAFGPGGTVVVANDVLNGSVREFAPNAEGNVAPIRTLAGPATAISGPFGLAVDSAGEIWVADVGNGAILIFGPGARGNTAPVRFISGAATGLTTPAALALDGAGDVLVADAQGPVEDFAAGVSGKTVAPFASLAGSRTGIANPYGVAISPPLLGVSTDALPAATVGTAYSQTVGAGGGVKPYRFSLASGALPAGLTLNAATGAITGTPTGAASSSFTIKVTDASQPTAQSATQALSIVVRPPVVPSAVVANGGSGTVTDYALSPFGNVGPLFTLGRGNQLSGPGGVAVDGTGRVYVANSGADSVSEFAPGVTSSAGPDVTIAGSNTGLDNPAGIALDAAGRIYVTSQAGNSVTVFAAGATGNAAPIATIAGSGTGLSGPAAATVTRAGDVWVANATNNSLTEYAPGAKGNAAPIATVAGPATALSSPIAIGLDEHANLLVASLYGESIARFAPTANGNVAPLGLIAGGNTTLDFPHGVDVDAQGRIYVVNQFGNSIAVFAAGATGSVAPIGTIAGGATGLSAPQAVAVVPPLSILTKRLPAGTVRHVYRTRLRGALGTTPYRWSVSRGRLPAGLRLSRRGVLAGVPRRPGRRWVTIEVSDAGHPRMTAHRRYRLTVRCPRVGHHRTCTVTHAKRGRFPLPGGHRRHRRPHGSRAR